MINFLAYILAVLFLVILFGMKVEGIGEDSEEVTVDVEHNWVSDVFFTLLKGAQAVSNFIAKLF